MKILSNIVGIIGAGLFIFNCFYPNSISRNAGTVAMGASTMLSRVNTLVNVGYGEEMEGETRSSYTDRGSSLLNHELCSYIDQCNYDFFNEEMGILNRKGGKFLNKLYINNEEFREEIINFVKDKKELDLDLILVKRCKTNTLNTLGNKYLAENKYFLIEIMVKFYPANE